MGVSPLWPASLIILISIHASKDQYLGTMPWHAITLTHRNVHVVLLYEPPWILDSSA